MAARISHEKSVEFTTAVRAGALTRLGSRCPSNPSEWVFPPSRYERHTRAHNDLSRRNFVSIDFEFVKSHSTPNSRSTKTQAAEKATDYVTSSRELGDELTEQVHCRIRRADMT